MKKEIIFLIGILFVLSLSGITFAETVSSKQVSITLVNQDPDPAIAGNIIEVRIGVENNGGSPAENIILELDPKYPFSKIPGEEYVQEVGSLQGYQSDADMKIVKFRLKVERDVTAGSYSLDVKESEKGTSFSITKSVDIDVNSNDNAEIIYIDKSILIPGKEDKLKFTVNNVGNSPLNDLSFSWENEDMIILPVGSDNTKYIDHIDVGDSKELEYNVIADSNADAGLYKLDLKLSYDDPLSNEDKVIDTIAGVYVGGSTDFDIAFSESSDGDTSFTIANIGSNPAFSVSVSVPKQEGWKISGSNSMIIGNLNKGDYTVASFNLQKDNRDNIRQQITQGKTSKNINPRNELDNEKVVKIGVSYTDTMGNRKFITKNVSVNPASISGSVNPVSGEVGTQAFSLGKRSRYQQQSFFSKYKWYILVLVIIILAIFGYKKYRNAKIKNPDAKLGDLIKKPLKGKSK